MSILHTPEIKHRQTLSPRLPQASNTLDIDITSESDGKLSSNLEEQINTNALLNTMNNKTSYFQDSNF